MCKTDAAVRRSRNDGQVLIMSVWGAIAQGAANLFTTKYANDENQKEAGTNRNWQEYMSNTAFQRTMTDLQKAGLNPILAGKVGGASTPAGNVANIKAADVGSSALAGYMAKEQLANLKADTNRKIEEADLLWEKVRTERYMQNKMQTEMYNLREAIELIKAQVNQTNASALGLQYENVGKSVTADIYDSLAGTAFRTLEKLGIGPAAAKSIVDRLFGRKKQ